MSHPFRTPWHKRSVDRFLEESLPRLLEERVPLAGYAIAGAGPHVCQISLSVSSGVNGDLALVYDGIPHPDEEGIFWLEDAPYVVVPIADREELDRAEVRCVGEQLHAYVEARLGHAPADEIDQVAPEQFVGAPKLFVADIADAIPCGGLGHLVRPVGTQISFIQLIHIGGDHAPDMNAVGDMPNGNLLLGTHAPQGTPHAPGDSTMKGRHPVGSMA